MRIIKFFIASSIVEFEKQRKELGEYILSLNKSVYEARGIRLEWVAPENMSHAMAVEGLQAQYDAAIRESQFFFLVTGQRMGRYTEHEFNIAWERFTSSHDSPKIFTWFLRLEGQPLPESVRLFRDRLKDLNHYPNYYSNRNAIRTALTDEIARELPTVIPEEEDADLSIKRIATRIQHNLNKIEERKTMGLTWDGTIPQIVELFTENVRLVKKYHVEPDAVYLYAEFLYGQSAYHDAVELLNWLGKLYMTDGATAADEARRLNLMGECYYWSNHFIKAKDVFQRALELRRELAHDNPIAFLPDVAMTCNNLGNTFWSTNRMNDAELFYRESLDIRRKLAKGNPITFQPYVAMACNNLGILLMDTNRPGEAELLYREALNIFRTLAKENPSVFLSGVARTCNNLGLLLTDIGRITEAEPLCLEALNIVSGLVKINPAAHEINLACYKVTMANLLAQSNRKEEAIVLYNEALITFKKYPDHEKHMEIARKKLSPYLSNI